MPQDKKTELFYWVDENDVELGSVTRAEAHNGSHKIHRAVSIVLFNSQGQTLLQERSIHKDLFPGFWTTAASGHLEYGQSYEEAAARELFEEVGITVPLKYQTKYLLTNDQESEFDAVFIGQTDVTPEKLDPFEVASVKWFTPAAVQALADENKLTHPAIMAFKHLNFI